ncbi:MAG: hypothetical protein V3S29_10495 [bacterium]
MDQKYIETVRACKVILRNLDHLDDTATLGQRAELERLMLKVADRLNLFLDAEENDEGLWVGEE